MGSHFEGTQFDQAKAQPETLGRIKLVDTELGAMRVSRDVAEQVAEQPTHRARRAVIRSQIPESDLQFVQGISACLVYTRRLAGRTDIHTRKQIRERGMILPECNNAAQKIGE